MPKCGNFVERNEGLVDIFILSVVSLGYFGLIQTFLVFFLKKKMFCDHFWDLLVIQGYFNPSDA
jgi:hypothetical protein